MANHAVRDNTVSVRLNDEELVLFKARAKSFKSDQSTYMRDAVLNGWTRDDIDKFIQIKIGSMLEMLKLANDEMCRSLSQHVQNSNAELLRSLHELDEYKRQRSG